jgi:hypothetical protein
VVQGRNSGERAVRVAPEKLRSNVVPLAVAVCIVNEEPGLADEVVVVLIDGEVVDSFLV